MMWVNDRKMQGLRDEVQLERERLNNEIEMKRREERAAKRSHACAMFADRSKALLSGSFAGWAKLSSSWAADEASAARLESTVATLVHSHYEETSLFFHFKVWQGRAEQGRQDVARR